MSTATINNTKQDIVYHLFKAMQKDRLNYVYRGNFTQEMTHNILELTESNLLNKEDKRALNRKVYHVMVEGLQNITRHQAKIKHNMGQSYGLFALKKEDEKYYLTTGNIIENSDIQNLSGKIDRVNGFDRSQLKDFHKEVLQNGKISEKGGAGLGLIDIARRAGSKLLYAFNKINSKLSYFYLHAEITSTSSIHLEDKTGKNLFFNYNLIHPILNEENILMVFNNTFSQNNLLDLLSFVEKQMKSSSQFKRKMYNILIEMFQNISKHSYDYKLSTEKKSGLFYISETENEYCLTTGNYISSKSVKSLRGRLNYVNNLNIDDLEEFYEKRLFDFDINSNAGAGLGLIDLKLKSEEKLHYNFTKVAPQISFYSLKVKIRKD